MRRHPENGTPVSKATLSHDATHRALVGGVNGAFLQNFPFACASNGCPVLRIGSLRGEVAEVWGERVKAWVSG